MPRIPCLRSPWGRTPSWPLWDPDTAGSASDAGNTFALLTLLSSRSLPDTHPTARGLGAHRAHGEHPNL